MNFSFFSSLLLSKTRLFLQLVLILSQMGWYFTFHSIFLFFYSYFLLNSHTILTIQSFIFIFIIEMLQFHVRHRPLLSLHKPLTLSDADECVVANRRAAAMKLKMKRTKLWYEQTRCDNRECTETTVCVFDDSSKPNTHAATTRSTFTFEMCGIEI